MVSKWMIGCKPKPNCGQKQREIMQDNTEEWLELCRQASVEQDGDRLVQLTTRITELLDQKRRRLNQRVEDRPLLRHPDGQGNRKHP